MVLLLFLLTLVLAVASVSAIYIKQLLAQQKVDAIQQRMQNLNQVKANLLSFAKFTPEIYATDTNGNVYGANRVPGPGYLPCPDTNNDGSPNTPCGQGATFAFGRLPLKITSRQQFFVNPTNQRQDNLYWYAVDARFVQQNSDYNNPPIQRFAPLNSQSPANPVLNYQGQANIVAVIMDANLPLASQTGRPSNLASDYLEGENANGDALFTGFNADLPLQLNQVNDYVVVITHAEWQKAIEQRVGSQKTRLCQLLPLGTEVHWFNGCHNDENDLIVGLDESVDANCPEDDDVNILNTNPTGSNWRAILGCP